MDDPRIASEPNDVPNLSREEREEIDERDYRPRRRLPRHDYQKDREHLNLLSIFYFVFCGLQCFGLLFALLYMVLGIVMLAGGMGSGPKGPPPEAGFVLIGFALVILLLGGTMATCLGLTGSYLRKQKKRTFCFVIACIICASVPFGTLLGIFTILVLNRESVKELFARGGQWPTEDERDETYRR